MLTFAIVAFMTAVGIFAFGQMQARRSGKKKSRWAGPLSAFGLVLMALSAAVFSGLESFYVWAAGLGLFFVGFFAERIGDLRQELRETEDLEH